jgi:hypothetical protein
MAKINMSFCNLTDTDRDQPRIKSTATKSIKCANDTAKYPERWQAYFKRIHSMYHELYE